MMPAISVTIYQYSAYWSKLKLESRAIVVGVAMSKCNLDGKYHCRPHPGYESARASFIFSGRQNVSMNYIRAASSLDGNIVDHVCLKAEFLWHTVLSNENGEFYTYDIYPYLNRSVCLLMGSPTWWRFSFCSTGSSLVFWWRDAPLVREFQMWGRRCKQWDSHWFQGHKKRFSGIFNWTDLHSSYFTGLYLHAVYNTWLTPITAYGSQSTACGIEMRRGKPWISVNCIFQENIWSENWHIYFKLRIFYFK